MFANLFKPKWRHSDPDVRVTAVAKLSPDRPEQLSILRELALSDSSSRVRISAIHRLQDTELLLQILSSTSDPDVREHASLRVGECLGPEISQESLCRLLDRIDDDSARTQIIINANGLKPDALNRIDDEVLLMQLALHARVADTRKAAVTRLENAQLLEQVQRASRGRDKTVHRICRDKLNDLREQTRKQAENEQRRQQLVQLLQQLTLTDDTQFLQARTQAAHQEWQQLTHQNDELCARYQDLRRQLDQRLQQQAAREAAEAEAVARRKQQLETAQGVIATLEQWLEAQPEPQSADNLASLEHTWEQLDIDQLPQSLVKRKHALGLQLQQSCQALERLAHHQTDVLALLDQPAANTHKQLEQARKLRSAIEWPGRLPLPPLLLQLDAHIQSLRDTLSQAKQEARQYTNDLASQLDQLEALINDGNIIAAEQLNNSLREHLHTLPDTLEARQRLLHARLADLRDWQGFAAAGKKDALCEQMEALIGSGMSPQTLADRIRTLQQEWKQVDSTDTVHSQKLWKRFHEAGEKAYEPCQAWFGSQRKQREYNLEQRIQICDQLSLYINQMDWTQADWHAVEAISRTAREEWRRYSPVDRAPGKPLQQTFNMLLRDLDNRIKAQRQQCADSKEALIAQATELAQQDDVVAAAEGAKQLQREWKTLGATFRSRERALWQAFREQCDTIFERLKAARKTEAKAQQAAKAQRSQEPVSDSAIRALQRLDLLASQTEEELATDGRSDTLSALLTEAVTGPSPGPGWRERMGQRLEAIRLICAGTRSIEEQLLQTEHQARELCIRLEILLGQPSPESDEALRMTYQMERLSQALEQQDCEPTPAALQALELEWFTLPYYWHFTELRERFDNLLEQA